MYDLERSTRLRRPWFPFALLLACYALFDCLAPTAFALLGKILDPQEFPPLSMICVLLTTIGCLAGQFGALAAWGVLGTQPPRGHWLASLFAAAASLLLTGAVAAVAIDGKIWREVRDALLLSPITFLAVQIPVLAMRLGWGYRVTITDQSLPAPRRFTLRELFFATGVIAASLALLQIGAKNGPRPGTAGVAGGCALAGIVWGLFAVLPCLYSALMAKDGVMGGFFIASYAIGAALTATAVALALGSRDTIDILLLCSVIFGVAAFTLHGSFLVLRHCGYRLRRIQPGTSGPSA